MGLPQINIIFEGLANTINFRSERGIVAIILKDDTPTVDKTSYVFNRAEDIPDSTFKAENVRYLKLVLAGSPNKVLVEVISTTNKRTVDTVLKDLELKRFNYLTMPEIGSDTSKIVNWIKAQRKLGKMYKAVVKNVADDEGIINFDTTGIKCGTQSYSTEEFCTRIAGILAGLPLTRSATYYVLKDVTEITQPTDPDADIEAGKLILINDGTKIKIGRGVNSLTTVNSPKTNDMKKIKIIEAMDMVRDDIHTTFEENYVGQVSNTYDNKIIFLSSVNLYFSRLQREEVLDSSYDCYVEIDVNKHIEVLTDKGIDVDTLSEQQIKEINTGSNVYASGRVQFVDAMEDLDLKLFM